MFFKNCDHAQNNTKYFHEILYWTPNIQNGEIVTVSDKIISTVPINPDIAKFISDNYTNPNAELSHNHLGSIPPRSVQSPTIVQ